MRGIAVSMGIPTILPGEYRNPFDFLREFDKWFEFEERKHYRKESTYSIVRDMLRDDPWRASKAMDANYTAAKWLANQQFGTYQPERQTFLTGVSY